MRKRQTITLVFAVLGLALVAIAVTAFSAPGPGFPGAKAILDHPQINEAVSSGRGTVAYFSAPNCPACMLQDRSMDALYSEYSQQVNFVYFKNSKELAGVFEDWSVFKVPTLVFINKDGIVVSRYDGAYLNFESLEKEVERIK